MTPPPPPPPGPLVDLELVVNARRRLEAALTHVVTIEQAARALDELVNDPDDPVAKLELVAPERSTSAPAGRKPKPRKSAPAPATEGKRRKRHAKRDSEGVAPDVLKSVEAHYRKHPGEWLSPGAVGVTLGLSRPSAGRAHRELAKRKVLEHNGKGTNAARYRLNAPSSSKAQAPRKPKPAGSNKPAIEPEAIPEAIRDALRGAGGGLTIAAAFRELDLSQGSRTADRVRDEMRAMAGRGELVITGNNRGNPVYDLAPDGEEPIDAQVEPDDEPPVSTEPSPDDEPDDDLDDLDDDDGNPDPDDEPGPFPDLDDDDPDDAIAPRRPAGPLTPPPGKMPSSDGLSPRTAKSVERAELEAAEAAANATRNGRSPAAERILESMLHGDGAGTITELATRLDIPRRDVAGAIAELEEDETAGLCRAGKRAGNIVYTAID